MVISRLAVVIEAGLPVPATGLRQPVLPLWLIEYVLRTQPTARQHFGGSCGVKATGVGLMRACYAVSFSFGGI